MAGRRSMLAPAERGTSEQHGVERTLVRGGAVEPGPVAAALCSVWLPLSISALVAMAFVREATVRIDGRTAITLFDDAMVSMRYGANLADGHGLVWNPGEAGVEGYTNLLWTLWMAVLHLAGLPSAGVALAIVATGFACLVVTVVAVRRLAEELCPRRRDAVAAATWLTALSYPLLYWTLRGMEVGLVAAVVAVGALAAVRTGRGSERAPVWLVGAIVLGVLTRVDAVVPLAVCAAYAVLLAGRARRRRLALVLGGALAAVLVVRFGASLVLYGELLPNTYRLKVDGAPLDVRLERGLATVVHRAVTGLWAPLLLCGLALVGERGRDLIVRSLPLAVAASGLGYAAWVGGDAWEWMPYADRYVCTVLPVLLAGAAAGAARLTRDGRLGRWSAAAVLGGAAAVGMAVTATGWAWRGPVLYRQPSWDGHQQVQVLVLLLVVAAGLVVGLGRARLTAGAPAWRAAGVALLAAAVFVGTSWAGFTTWRTLGVAHVDADAVMTRVGTALDDRLPPETSLAVVWAGSLPYYADRPTVDLLGKSDAVVAGRPAQWDDAFWPGHGKWDFDHSIGERRPDVVIGSWPPQQPDALEAVLAAHGYARIVDENGTPAGPVHVAPWVDGATRTAVQEAVQDALG